MTAEDESAEESVMSPTVELGKVFDRTVDLDGVPDACRAMEERESIKVMVP